MLVASALAAVLLAARAHGPDFAARAVPGPDCPPFALHLGPADAPLTIAAYLDPFAPTTFGLWLDLRRLVADHDGALGVRVVPIATTMVETLGDARILRVTVSRRSNRSSLSSSIRSHGNRCCRWSSSFL